MASHLTIWRRTLALSQLSILALASTLSAFPGIDSGGARADTTCWHGPVPQGVDPCGLIEQANDLLARLANPVERYVLEIAGGLDVERSLRVQEGLLREHLAWENDALTKRQTDVMVFVAIAVSLDRAQERIAELHGTLEGQFDERTARRLDRVELYRSQALTYLDGQSPGMREIPERELSFRF
jgi:hypothetical protein